MNPLTIDLANLPETVMTGDLTDSEHSQSPAVFTLDPAIFTAAVLGKPISAIRADVLSANLSPSHDFSWTQQLNATDSVTFKVTPTVSCSLQVRKKGLILEASDIHGDPIQGYQLEVPAGKGYVSIILKVSLDVSLGASASLPDGIGLKACFNPSDTFIAANHFIFDQSKLVKDAILESFGRFMLPLGPNSASQISSLNSGDLVESEFVAKLALTAAVKWGLNASLVAGLSKGDLQVAANSSIGSILAKATPSAQFGPSLTFDYTHKDAFRSVVLAQDAFVSLLLFKCRTDDDKITAEVDAKVDPGLSAQIALKLPQAIQNGAKQLGAGASGQEAAAFKTAVTGAAVVAPEALQAATDDVNAAISSQIKKLPTLEIKASVGFEQIAEHTVLSSLVFNRPLDALAWKAAMSGDLRHALLLGSGANSDVKLGLGSYVEDLLTKKTTFTFTFFGLKAQQISEYFNDVKFTYTGNGSFQFLDKIGAGESYDFFGHEKAAHLYFIVTASLAAKVQVSNEAVKLFIVLSDKNAYDHSKLLARTLTALVGSPKSQPYVDLLTRDLAHNARLPVRLSAQCAASAFGQLKVSARPFGNQTADRENFRAFVSAVNSLAINSEDMFPPVLNYDVWVRFNKNLIGLSTPDRTQTGFFGNHAVAFEGIFEGNWPDDGTLGLYAFWLEEARHFMNFCDDLIKLANLTAPASAGKGTALGDLLDTVMFTVKNDVINDPLHLLNAILLALVRQMRDVNISAGDPPVSDTPPKKFEVTLEVDAKSGQTALAAAP